MIVEKEDIQLKIRKYNRVDNNYAISLCLFFCMRQATNREAEDGTLSLTSLVAKRS